MGKAAASPRQEGFCCLLQQALFTQTAPGSPSSSPLPSPPPPPRQGVSGVGLEWVACCKYSGATLKVFITPDGRSCLENPALHGEVGKHYFCSLTDGSAPGKEREEGKLDLPYCHSHSSLCASCQEHAARSVLAKVKRRALGCAQAGGLVPRGDGFRGA